MYTKKIDICIYIFIYTVYTWLSTTDTLKIQRLCYRVKPVFHRSLGAQNQRLWSAKKIWSGRVHVQRDSCSSTAPCVLKKGDRPRWPGRSCQWGCDLFKKSIVGKDGEHQIGCECLSLADQEHTACFFSNQTERERIMFSTTVTMFSQIERYVQKPCVAATWETWQMRRKDTSFFFFFNNTGSED